MATDSSNTGFIKVDGQWADTVRFSVFTSEQGTPKEVMFHFLNGTDSLATARMSDREARELLGERNYRVIAMAVPPDGQSSRDGPFVGELKGKSLQFSDIKLPREGDPPDNTIEKSNREKDAQKAAANDRQMGMEPNPVQPDEPESEPKSQRAIPPAIAQRFLRIDNKYYFPDRTLAFVDRGTKIKASTHNQEVIRSLVAIAQARGWDALGVSGTEEFRREVWREASRHGIEVSGYKPTELERLQLQRSLDRGASRDDGHSPSDARAPSTGARPEKRDNSPPEPMQERPPRMLGQLLDHGAAPYQFDPKGRLSYFVKLQMEHGEKVLWGTDLERALVESSSGVGIGDTVVVERRGGYGVKVKLPKRDRDGNLVGEETVEKRRTQWRIEKPMWFEQQAAKADAIHEGTVPKHELAKAHPDLTNAVVALWLGEQFAATAIGSAEDRARVLALLRKAVARAVEQAETIRVPTLNEGGVQKLDREKGRGGRPPRVRTPPHARPERDIGAHFPTHE
jgi:hypothetical protein